jgi:hypothetical protein
MIFQRGHSGREKSSGSWVLGRTTTWSQRGRFQSPARVTLDVVTQRVAGFAGLTNRFDVHMLAAAELAPAIAVVPDLAALDLQADDAGALDRDDEVDLVILEVIGDALARNDEVGGLELLDERLVDAALGTIGQARGLGRRDGHGLAGPTPSSETRISKPPRSARFLCATPMMLSSVTPCSASIAARTPLPLAIMQWCSCTAGR